MHRSFLDCLRLRFGLRRAIFGPRRPMAVPNDPPRPFRLVKRDGFIYVEPRPVR